MSAAHPISLVRHAQRSERRGGGTHDRTLAPSADLRQIITREALAGAPPELDLAPYLDWFRGTYGDELALVLLYGSVISPELRSPTSTPDFIVVTESGRIAAHSRATRLLHDVLAPTSRSARIETATGRALFKYLHLDLGQLARATGPALPDLFVAGRLCKQVRILYVRDPGVREAAIDALVASVRQVATLVRAIMPPVFDLDRLVLESLAISYRGEWRIEAPDKVLRLARAGRAHYRAVQGALLDEQLAAGRVRDLGAGRYAPVADARERRKTLHMLRRTRVRAALRWPKHAVTVPHAGELVAGKLERAHPGMRVPGVARRHPFLCALPMLLWLLLRGALRGGQAGAARATTATRADVSNGIARPRIALVANLNARRVRRHGFDAAAYARVLGDGALIRGVDSWPALRAAVAEACARGVDAIAVLGGDGTLGGVVSELIAHAPDARPAIVPLSGGGFNQAARTLGATRAPGRDLARLARLIAHDRPMEEHTVRVLRIDDPAHQPSTRFGFFFGAGVVYEYSRHISEHGGTGFWNSVRHSVGLTLGGLAGSTRGTWAWRQFPAALKLDRAHVAPGAFTAVCACAVVARSLLVRPLPAPRAPASGTFVYLASALSREEILRRRLLSVLRGRCRDERHLAGHASAIHLESDCGYLLDGELVPSREHPREIVVSSGPEIRFWLPRGCRRATRHLVREDR